MKLAGRRSTRAQGKITSGHPGTDGVTTMTTDGVDRHRPTTIDVATWTETTKAFDLPATAVVAEAEVRAKAAVLRERAIRRI